MNCPPPPGITYSHHSAKNTIFLPRTAWFSSCEAPGGNRVRSTAETKRSLSDGKLCIAKDGTRRFQARCHYSIRLWVNQKPKGFHYQWLVACRYCSSPVALAETSQICPAWCRFPYSRGSICCVLNPDVRSSHTQRLCRSIVVISFPASGSGRTGRLFPCYYNIRRQGCSRYGGCRGLRPGGGPRIGSRYQRWYRGL